MFIQKSKEAHGENKYTYEKAVYVNNSTPIIIHCCTCENDFNQRPSVHMKGHGCNMCSIETIRQKNRVYKKDFVIQAKNIHNSKYTYDNISYIDQKSKINIYCTECNVYFLQTPNCHLQGNGCPYCGQKVRDDKKRMGKNEFIKRAIEIHGSEKYKYDNVKYINIYTKVSIYCIFCSSYFLQKPREHLNGCGCNLSCFINSKLSFTYFVKRSIEIHGYDKYIYNETEYVNMSTHINIFCNTCKVYFKQTPARHLYGRGCSRCAKKGYSKASNKWLTHIENTKGIKLQTIMSPEGERRIGKYRADGFHEDSRTVYEYHGDFWHGNPKFYDPSERHPMSKVEYGKLMKKTLHKEMYIRDKGYNYVCIWGHEWKEQKKNMGFREVTFRLL